MLTNVFEQYSRRCTARQDVPKQASLIQQAAWGDRSPPKNRLSEWAPNIFKNKEIKKTKKKIYIYSLITFGCIVAFTCRCFFFSFFLFAFCCLFCFFGPTWTGALVSGDYKRISNSSYLLMPMHSKTGCS